MYVQFLHEGHNTPSNYDDVAAQVKTILEEMGHTYNLSTVRILGFFLAKLLRNLYQGVAINNNGFFKVQICF